MIDCPSIININRLIDIDCHRLPSIIDFIDCSGPVLKEKKFSVVAFCVRLANFFLSSISFDRLQSFDEIQLNSIDFDYRMFDYIGRDTKVVKTKSFFPSLSHQPNDHENNLPVQSRVVPRDLPFLLTTISTVVLAYMFY